MRAAAPLAPSLPPLATTLVITLAVTFTAGCVDAPPQPAAPDATLDADACDVSVDKVPAHARPGAFSFGVRATCVGVAVAGLGASWSDASVPRGTAVLYPNDCVVSGGVARCDHPGGQAFVRAWVERGDGVREWGREYVVVEHEAPDVLAGTSTLSLFNVPARVAAGEPFSFRVEGAWPIPPPGADAVVDARAHVEGMGVEALPGTTFVSCASQSSLLPGTYDVVCGFSVPGTYWVRAHATTVPDVEHWSQAVPVVVV